MSRRSRSRLLRIPGRVPAWERSRRQIQRLRIPHAQRAVLHALLSHWQAHPVACQGGRIFLGFGQPDERWRSRDGRERVRGGRPGIADLGGLSRRHALRCRHALERGGWIRVRPGGGRGKANAYELSERLTGIASWMDRETPQPAAAAAAAEGPGRLALREAVERLRRRGPPPAA